MSRRRNDVSLGNNTRRARGGSQTWKSEVCETTQEWREARPPPRLPTTGHPHHRDGGPMFKCLQKVKMETNRNVTFRIYFKKNKQT